MSRKMIVLTLESIGIAVAYATTLAVLLYPVLEASARLVV